MRDSLKHNLIGISTVALLVSIYVVENVYIKIVIGIALIIGLVISMIMIHKTIEMTDNQKRLSWIIIVPLISLIVYLYSQIKKII